MKNQARHRSPWLVVLGSGLAQTVGIGPLILSTFGLFVLPIAAKTGWSRATVSVAFTAAAVGFAIGTPVAGHLLDRYAYRIVVIPSWILYAVSVASIAVVPCSLPVFYLPFLMAGFFAGGTFLPAFKAVLSWFDNKRGLAIGVVAAIGALGASLTSVLARALMNSVGWRQAYAWMALVAAAVSVTMITTLVKVRAEQSHRGRLVQAAGASDRASILELPGLNVREALASRHLWMISAILCLSGLAVIGIQVNVVPMMTDEGLRAGQAASLLSVYAGASLTGRLVSGALLDHVPARFVTAVVLLCPVAGMVLLRPPFASAAVGIALVGVAFGMEIDVLSFLISRYLGMRRFGSLFGIVYFGVLSVSAFGPLAINYGHQVFGNYRSIFPAIAAALVLCSLTSLFLGPYRYPAVHGFDQAVQRPPERV